MNIEQAKEKKHIKEIFSEIGVWKSEDIEEKFYKNGKEIPKENSDESSSQKTLFYEDGELLYELSSDGDKTILCEYDDGEEVEKFILSEEELYELLNLN